MWNQRVAAQEPSDGPGREWGGWPGDMEGWRNAAAVLKALRRVDLCVWDNVCALSEAGIPALSNLSCTRKVTDEYKLHPHPPALRGGGCGAGWSLLV